jgi:hypothetical protein
LDVNTWDSALKEFDRLPRNHPLFSSFVNKVCLGESLYQLVMAGCENYTAVMCFRGKDRGP